MENLIQIKSGDLELEGLLACPRHASAGVVICHPHPLYGGNMYVPVIETVTKEIQSEGIATLRFNFRGVGESQGNHSQGTGEVEDALAAVDLLLSHLSLNPRLGMCGYSFGGMVSLRACARDSRIAALVGIAPVIDPPDVLADWRKPKLFLSGSKDTWVKPESLETVVEAMPEPRELRIIKGANHFFPGFERDVARAVASFFKTCLLDFPVFGY